MSNSPGSKTGSVMSPRIFNSRAHRPKIGTDGSSSGGLIRAMGTLCRVTTTSSRVSFTSRSTCRQLSLNSLAPMVLTPMARAGGGTDSSLM